MTKTNYDVGYGKPPKDSQFKEGNPGRRRGTKKPQDNGFAALIDRELDTRVWATIGGKRKLATMRQVITKQQVNAAANGDFGALDLLMKLNAHVHKRGEKPNVIVTVEGLEPDEWRRRRDAAENKK